MHKKRLSKWVVLVISGKVSYVLVLIADMPFYDSETFYNLCKWIRLLRYSWEYRADF